VDKLKQEMKNEFGQLITIDGIKAIIDENSWVLIRKSNTENSIRISCESNDLEKAESIKQHAIQLVNENYAKISK
jgi:phosphomannomutase